ncbi:BglG family transcription antiterminator LicT [Streptococcus cuniculipharyngis]|uniref:PRD domain-containing protein n=1 Tax=Streptococcus cuniculipharyngis TaxID=1562651 RepID=A0A5C5SGA6_9STRE|nr:PRD domain-containing protein [Streptococcus cuniculipharyngis]TWS98941.1 PRD domain-containing protein [Streptococcus cuniculipharyngis]
MQIERVYNNNVVQVFDDKNREVIVMGRGIGFQRKSGDFLDPSLIEKKFVLEDQEKAQELSQIYGDLKAEEIDLVMAVIKHGQALLEEQFDISLYIALADHLHYALTRLTEGLALTNPLAWEIRKFCPKEYEVGLYATDLMTSRLGLSFVSDQNKQGEAASVALHFINAQKNGRLGEKNQQVGKMIVDILEIIRLHFGSLAEETSLNYHRLVTHINYFAQRVVNGMVQGQNDAFLYEQVKVNYPQAFACTEKIKTYVEQAYDFPMSRDEQVYLTIHIQRQEMNK